MLSKGTLVRLKSHVNFTCPEGRENNPTAKIEVEMDSFSIGAVKLDRDLHGCKYWNKEDLEAI